MFSGPGQLDLAKLITYVVSILRGTGQDLVKLISRNLCLVHVEG